VEHTAGPLPRRRRQPGMVCRHLVVQLYNMPGPLVIDTSAILAVLLNEPARPSLIRMTEGCTLVGAPSLPWELGHALLAGVRRKRLSGAEMGRAWRSFRGVPVRLANIEIARALEVAVQLGLYAYDAYVLETARAERLHLLTLDVRLARAARAMGLKLLEVEA
jgi:predicted nucleic acid-binding protein